MSKKPKLFRRAKKLRKKKYIAVTHIFDFKDNFKLIIHTFRYNACN